jgi:hypothetical protein
VNLQGEGEARLQRLLTSALEADEPSASRSSGFKSGTHYVGSSVGTRVGLNREMKTEILAPVENQTRLEARII